MHDSMCQRFVILLIQDEELTESNQSREVRMRPNSIQSEHRVTMPRNMSAAHSGGRERGFVLITMAVAAIALIGVLGMSVDVGRMFIAKNETQNYCDSAALAAALALDGTLTGIASAQNAVTNSANAWNLNTTTVKNPTVTFATSLSGPFVASPSPADGYNVARVSATVAMQLFFIPVIVAQTTTNVASSATAAQVALTSIPRGLAPYTAVSTNTTGPNFGMVVGNSYSIHWPQFNSNRQS